MDRNQILGVSKARNQIRSYFLSKKNVTYVKPHTLFFISFTKLNDIHLFKLIEYIRIN